MVLLLLASLAASGQDPWLRLEESQDAMGTTYSVVLYGRERAELQAAAEQAFEEVRRLELLLSNYLPRSQWSQMNRYAAERPVWVNPELFRLLSDCLEYSRNSEGTFDITVGPLMKVWGFYRGTGRLPAPAEVRGALAKVGYAHVALDAASSTVRFLRPGVELDPGGIGKGYAVDRMVEALKAAGIRSALVSASGSSIYALGTPPDESGWRVRIRDPKHPETTIEEVRLKDESMSTSGSYEKFFRAEGRVYSHIMDPRTGYPAAGTLAVSAIAPRTIDSEVWTKPFFIQGRDWTARHKPAGFRVYFCEDKSGQACAWLQ